jgi:CRISPR-associated protein Cmr1
MKEVRFRCRVLTPMFLGGSDPDDDPEFRPPSLRGMLRYWYRALLGARGVSDHESLLEKAGEVFGTTNKASPIRVRITSDGKPDTNAPAELLRGDGRCYLWHFIQAGDNSRSGISPGESFEVRLSAVPRRSGKSSLVALKEATRAFWLLVHLGGLGLRSRRCAGAFRARCIDHPSGLELPSFDPETPLAEWFRAKLGTLNFTSSASTTPKFDHLGRARIWTGGTTFARCRSAVDEIGAAYKEFRDRLTDGQKVALGLPIVQGDDQVQVRRPDGDVERRASPLWIQLLETPSGHCQPIYTLFEGPLLPNSDKATVNGRPFGQAVRQRALEFVRGQDGEEIYVGG